MLFTEEITANNKKPEQQDMNPTGKYMKTRPPALTTLSGNAVSNNDWRSKTGCNWKPQYLEIKFAPSIILSHFSFESSVGEQPTSYRLYGGACEKNSSDLLFEPNQENVAFSGEIKNKRYLNKFCLRIGTVSGYSPSSASSKSTKSYLRQKSVHMHNFKFWECKYLKVSEKSFSSIHHFRWVHPALYECVSDRPSVGPSVGNHFFFNFQNDVK